MSIQDYQQQQYEQPQAYQNQAQTMSNQDFLGASALQIRLDTSEVIERIELFLRSQRIEDDVDEKTGAPIKIVISEGEPRVNDYGFNAIMGRIRMIINTPVVQGNYSEERYNYEIGKIRESFAESLMVNMGKYGIEETQYNDIVDAIMDLVIPFLSRLVNNGERNSFAKTLMTNETTTLGQQRKGLLGRFFKN